MERAREELGDLFGKCERVFKDYSEAQVSRQKEFCGKTAETVEKKHWQGLLKKAFEESGTSFNHGLGVEEECSAALETLCETTKTEFARVAKKCGEVGSGIEKIQTEIAERRNSWKESVMTKFRAFEQELVAELERGEGVDEQFGPVKKELERIKGELSAELGGVPANIKNVRSKLC